MTTLLNLPPSSFPIPATTFYTSYLLPCRPFDVTSTAATSVDIKHSAHKSLTAFLRSCAKEGLIKIKEGKGEIVVVGQVVASRSFMTRLIFTFVCRCEYATSGCLNARSVAYRKKCRDEEGKAGRKGARRGGEEEGEGSRASHHAVVEAAYGEHSMVQRNWERVSDTLRCFDVT
jgi:hypothetical protein